MKTLIPITFLLSLLFSSHASASTGIACTLVDPFDDWVLEISGDQLAFWDNNQWSLAQYRYTIETTRPIDVFTNTQAGEAFEVQLGSELDARLILRYEDEVDTFEFTCQRNQELMYFE